jgi:BASS family bile acid:Na+ symporter
MELELFIRIGLPVSLATIMFSMGLALQPTDFQRVVAKPNAFFTGLGAQMLLLPLLALVLQWMFHLPPLLAVGLMVLSFCPGGTSSNLFSYIARGDVALSVALTAAASVITPFTIPILTEVALHSQLGESRQVSIPIILTMFRLLIVTIVPLSAGMLWNRLWSVSAEKAHVMLHRLSIALFALVIISIVVQQLGKSFGFFGQIGVVCAVMILAAFFTGYVISRLSGLDGFQRKTVVIEVGMQNGGMALIVTQGVLHNPTMSMVPIVYGLLMLVPAISIALLARNGRLA